MSSITATEQQLQELVEAARAVEAERGIPAEQLLSIFSFETAGTLDPWKAGPTTQWGQHRGLIQWGEPQARQYGVSRDSTIRDQVFAAADYLGDRGYRPGMRMENMYAAVLAGDANRTGVGDLHNGGVARSASHATQTQFGPHTSAATSLLQRFPGSLRTHGPNLASDFNQQELAHIAPPTPATSKALRAAMQLSDAVPQTFASVPSPATRATAMASRNVPGLTPANPMGADFGQLSPPQMRSPTDFQSLSNGAGGKPAAPTYGTSTKSPSSFPARPAFGGGMPAAPSGGIGAMRAQAQQTIQNTARPTSDQSFPITRNAPQKRSPTDFQYATQPQRTAQPQTAIGGGPQHTSAQARSPDQFQYASPAPIQAPRAPSAPSLSRGPSRQARSPTDFQYAASPAPGPVAPSIPQVSVPPPQQIAPPMQLAPQAFGGKVPTFSSQAAAEMAAQIRSGKLKGAPQRGMIQQAFEGFNDWASNIGNRIQGAPQRAAKQFAQPMNIAPPQQQNSGPSFLAGLLAKQPTNKSLNGRAQGPWNSTGGEGGFVW